jgi:transcriptional regulator with XRE-family HTH domain
LRDAIAAQIAKYLAAHRTTCRMTQSELAEKVGMSRASIGLIERGEGLPSVETLYALAVALECEAWDLLPLVKQVNHAK